MAEPVNIYEAKTQLSKLVDRAADGEEIVIARNGRPVARLVPLQRAAKRGGRGVWAGQVEIAPDFDETPQDVLDAMEEPIDPPGTSA
ncbi:MAG: type II toxin-antitoxin system Phd/YefM family antitoxin [Thermocrispum sp.]